MNFKLEEICRAIGAEVPLNKRNVFASQRHGKDTLGKRKSACDPGGNSLERSSPRQGIKPETVGTACLKMTQAPAVCGEAFY